MIKYLHIIRRANNIPTPNAHTHSEYFQNDEKLLFTLFQPLSCVSR